VTVKVLAEVTEEDKAAAAQAGATKPAVAGEAAEPTAEEAAAE
jgi:hypothetical protein